MQIWQQVDDGQLEEANLIQLAQNGDSEAFGVLYERHAPAVFRFVYSHMNSRLDAEDLTSDVFMRVWRSLSGYKDLGVPFIAYLFRVARNALTDYYRRSNGAKHLPLDERFIADWQPGPREAMQIGIEIQEVRQVLNELREDYRTVLTLRFIGGLSPDETAEVMGKSSGSVRVLQHRALTSLRTLLEAVRLDENEARPG